MASPMAKAKELAGGADAGAIVMEEFLVQQLAVDLTPTADADADRAKEPTGMNSPFPTNLC